MMSVTMPERTSTLAMSMMPHMRETRACSLVVHAALLRNS